MATNKELEALLSTIHEDMLRSMLADLQNPDKRTPQLYNAIIKELERNGIDCVLKSGEDGDNALQNLLNGVRSNMRNRYGEFSS